MSERKFIEVMCTIKHILVLEDDLMRSSLFKSKLKNHIVNVVNNVPAAIQILQSSRIDIAFLDHDLGGEQGAPSGPGTGYELAKWLEQNPAFCPKHVFLHSANPVGAYNMRLALPMAKLWPLAWLCECLSDSLP